MYITRVLVHRRLLIPLEGYIHPIRGNVETADMIMKTRIGIALYVSRIDMVSDLLPPSLDDEYVAPEPEYQPTALTPEPKPLHPWSVEFYDVSADQIIANELGWAKHALKKWIGIRPSNLERHKMFIDNALTLKDKETSEDVIVISWSSYALCHYQLDDRGEVDCNQSLH